MAATISRPVTPYDIMKLFGKAYLATNLLGFVLSTKTFSVRLISLPLKFMMSKHATHALLKPNHISCFFKISSPYFFIVWWRWLLQHPIILVLLGNLFNWVHFMSTVYLQCQLFTRKTPLEDLNRLMTGLPNQNIDSVFVQNSTSQNQEGDSIVCKKWRSRKHPKN